MALPAVLTYTSALAQQTRLRGPEDPGRSGLAFAVILTLLLAGCLIAGMAWAFREKSSDEGGVMGAMKFTGDTEYVGMREGVTQVVWDTHARTLHASNTHTPTPHPPHPHRL